MLHGSEVGHTLIVDPVEARLTGLVEALRYLAFPISQTAWLPEARTLFSCLRPRLVVIAVDPVVLDIELACIRAALAEAPIRCACVALVDRGLGSGVPALREVGVDEVLPWPVETSAFLMTVASYTGIPANQERFWTLIQSSMVTTTLRDERRRSCGREGGGR